MEGPAIKKLQCDGSCIEEMGEHVGTVRAVRVSSGPQIFYFNYCDAAVAIDKERGFTVEDLNV